MLLNCAMGFGEKDASLSKYNLKNMNNKKTIALKVFDFNILKLGMGNVGEKSKWFNFIQNIMNITTIGIDCVSRLKGVIVLIYLYWY